MNPKERALLIDALGSAIDEGELTLGQVPGLLRRVLETEAWRDFETKLGQTVHHDQFKQFVTATPLAGLGTTIEVIKRIVSLDPVALKLLDEAIEGHQGERTDLVYNIHNVDRPSGTSKMRAVRKLRKSRPDLLARVESGELSPHGAMVEAGFRRPSISVPTDDMLMLAQRLRSHLSKEQLAELLHELLHEIPDL